MDASAIRCVLKGVADEVEEDAAQFLQIHIHHQLLFRGVHCKVDVALGCFEHKGLRKILDVGHQVGMYQMEMLAVLVHLLEIEQAVHQVVETVGVL